MHCYSASISSLAPLLSVSARVRHPAWAPAIQARTPLDACDVVAAYHDALTRQSLGATGDATTAEQVAAWSRWLAVLLQHAQSSFPVAVSAETSVLQEQLNRLEAQHHEVQWQLRELRAGLAAQASRSRRGERSPWLVKTLVGLGPGLPGMPALGQFTDVALGAVVPCPQTLPELLAMTRFEIHVLSARLHKDFGVLETDDDDACRDKLFRFLVRSK
ncbi:hypothetical protein P43SY_007109 [Pythium insidiosum]|uniref:Uncharacterized protein n=1 Tax=Pythium insidiosum TaxID=114742 RepID=A0AAD5QBZ2_PYTIN|nr:hypothetical protein P43SY_007109 [Pythium insidiosum]